MDPIAAAILQRPLRANPALELVLFDRLPEGERRQLEALRQDPDFYGILRPRTSIGQTVRALDRETALLFLSLLEPGPLPAYVRDRFGREALRAVSRLVTDGVLEVAHQGAFVSGAAALEALGTPASQRAPAGRLARLSRDALRYAQALEEDQALLLSLRLYCYNSHPITPDWSRRLATAAAVEGFLGIGARGPHRALLERHWSRLPPVEGWLRWRARRADARTAPRTGPRYKLYISPRIEALEADFGRLLEALTATRPVQFKVGADARGLLRPDKLVLYFEGYDALSEAAERLTQPLEGVPPQGVPFTSEVGGDGLLSWGIDPPTTSFPAGTASAGTAPTAGAGRAPTTRLPAGTASAGTASTPGAGRAPTAGSAPGSSATSWRFWLTHRLASALLQARGNGGLEPWAFALERLRMEGVDTDTWTPGARLWRGGL